jgi:hypothetical protein
MSLPWEVCVLLLHAAHCRQGMIAGLCLQACRLVGRPDKQWLCFVVTQQCTTTAIRCSCSVPQCTTVALMQTGQGSVVKVEPHGTSCYIAVVAFTIFVHVA